MSASKRYKIDRKVKEHHRKARKALRGRPSSTCATAPPLGHLPPPLCAPPPAQDTSSLTRVDTAAELKKDPGIPNLWPYKEKLLQQVEQHKQQARATAHLPPPPLMPSHVHA
jgi:nuclear GTP-binding protein